MAPPTPPYATKEQLAEHYLQMGAGWDSIAALNKTSAFYQLASRYVQPAQRKTVLDLAKKCGDLANELTQFHKVSP